MTMNIKYTFRMPYNKAEKFVTECRGWNYNECSDYIDTYHIPYVNRVNEFFMWCKHYFGKVELGMCPKNFDLTIKGEVDMQEGFGEFESGIELWNRISEYTRDFQFVADFPSEEIIDEDDFTKVILRKKNNRFNIFYLDGKNRIKKQGKDGFIEFDRSYLENYCDEGCGKDYSSLLRKEDLFQVTNELKKLYGLEGYDNKDDYVTKLNGLNIDDGSAYEEEEDR